MTVPRPISTGLLRAFLAVVAVLAVASPPSRTPCGRAGLGPSSARPAAARRTPCACVDRLGGRPRRARRDGRGQPGPQARRRRARRQRPRPRRRPRAWGRALAEALGWGPAPSTGRCSGRPRREVLIAHLSGDAAAIAKRYDGVGFTRPDKDRCSTAGSTSTSTRRSRLRCIRSAEPIQASARRRSRTRRPGCARGTGRGSSAPRCLRQPGHAGAQRADAAHQQLDRTPACEAR
jgi:hypothetical protein